MARRGSSLSEGRRRSSGNGVRNQLRDQRPTRQAEERHEEELMANAWMVRAGRGGDCVGDFEQSKCVAVGFGVQTDLSGVRDRDALVKRLRDAGQWPGSNGASTVARFVLDVKQGDHVVTYDPGTRQYLVGKVTSGYRFTPKRVGNWANSSRDVAWTSRVLRDDLSASARNSLGSLLTVFEIRGDVWSEFESLLSGKRPQIEAAQGQTVPGSGDEEVGDGRMLLEEAEAQAAEFIKDRVLRLDWDEAQELVAGLLRAMGYRATVSPAGADRGRDVVASPDGLGLQQPRIRVEVKHRPREAIGAPEIRSFIGGLRPNDNGLYVSTGGFSKEALYEAERAVVPVTLLDLAGLVTTLLGRYEDLDPETKALVPLKRVYWPAG